MTRYRNENGKDIKLTKKEEVARDNEEKSWLSEKTERLIYLIAGYRKEICDSSVTFMGISALGDKKTRSAISETVQFWKELDPADAPDTIDWESPDGFHEISLSTLIGLGKSIGFQRQKSFSVKRAVIDKIESGKITTIEQAKDAFDAGMKA